MFALGQERTSSGQAPMSALPLKQKRIGMSAKCQKRDPIINVRFGSKADIGARPINVRFTPKSGHQNGSDYIRRGNSGQLSDIRSNPPCLIFTGGGKRRADTS